MNAIAPEISLRISEIFYSLQGETSRAGLPTVFIRLTGCPLRCTWCDTAYAFTGGQNMGLNQILEQTAQHGAKHVCVTGGEPLAQKSCLNLLTALCDTGYDVSIETSGALDISKVDGRVSRIMDLKAPGSGEAERNLLENLNYLGPQDELKIIIASREDYDWAKAQIQQHRLALRCPLLLSPAQGQLEPKNLAEWILEDKLPVRLQLQLHKLLWGNIPGK